MRPLLLGAAAWTAWAAWRDGGPLALIIEVDGEEQCFPALPEDATGRVVLEFEPDGEGLRLLRGGDVPEGFGGATFGDESPAERGRVRLELRRARPGARRGSLTLGRGTTPLWQIGDVRVGRSIPLSETATRVLGLPSEGAASIVFLDR